MIQKALEGTTGVRYVETNDTKVRRLLRTLGYRVDVDYSSSVGHIGVGIIKTFPPERSKFLWMNREKYVPAVRIGTVLFEHPYKWKDWYLQVLGRRYVSEGLGIAKFLNEQCNHEIFVGLVSEYASRLSEYEFERL